MPGTKKQPERTCVGCRAKKAKADLLRIVRTPEGTVETDAGGRKNGRGAYICPDIDCLTKAVRNGSLSRALGCGIPQEVFESLRKEIEGLD